ncbi:Fic family protein [Pedobacter sp. CCM 8938]|uniref:Fic family protein n=2 Tax=Pedobacter fastidiosus TaxID=2765361 RepID=A0ABR7KXE4_9SPHI|nr:Fic family protein [Pedobacter fastidiosus]MBC6112782.1 Fic family protein [Pedobacter fastidiosus]
MDSSLPLNLQEIIFSSSDTTLSRKINRMEAAGTLRKLAPRIYTPNLDEEPEAIIRRNIFPIIGHLYPGVLLSHRSALEFRPTATGNLFLTYTYNRKAELPGITLNIIKGEGNIEGDNLFSNGLYASQRERAMLENFQVSRKPGPDSRTLTIPQLEEKLEQLILTKGEEGLNAFRDRAKQIAGQLGMETEFERMNKLISAMLTTKPAKLLSSPVAKARAFGSPYDPARIILFEKLFHALQQPFPVIEEPYKSQRAYRNFAFFEAYFSNYIEGTKFELNDAKQIIETGKPMSARDEDSHDILGTYQLVSNRTEMAKTPGSPKELLDILRYRHKVLMKARHSSIPGEFKEKNNVAGNTSFVDHTLVRGTLTRGFDFYRALDDPFAKAAYMMFMVSEVHPFNDGNGRIARVMMNAELSRAGQSKIIIPTVFRIDYIGALRQLTRNSNPDVYIRMLQRAHLFSGTIKGEEIDEMQLILENSNAFIEDEGTILKIVG